MFAEDITDFFDDADFAVTAVFKPAAGVTKTVMGIFDRAYLGIGGDVEVESTTPSFTLPSNTLPSDVAHDDVLTITIDETDTDFAIKGIEPDGTGVTVLILEEQ